MLLLGRWACVGCGKTGLGDGDAASHAAEHYELELMLRAACLPHEPMLPIHLKSLPERTWF